MQSCSQPGRTGYKLVTPDVFTGRIQSGTGTFLLSLPHNFDWAIPNLKSEQVV